MNQAESNRKIVNQLKEHFRLELNAPLWQTALDASSNLLIIETRKPDGKSVNHLAINLVEGTKSWEGLDLENPWWTSLGDAAGGKLYLYEYGSSKVPQHKKLYAFHCGSGRLAWTKQGYRFIGAYQDSVKVAVEHPQQSGEMLFLSKKSGEELIDHQPISGRSGAVTLPFRYHVENNYYDSLNKFVSDMVGDDPHGPIDYLQIGDRMAIGYQTPGPQGISRNLLITSLAGSPEYHTVLDQAVKGIAPAGFFRSGKYLIGFVENREVLCIKL